MKKLILSLILSLGMCLGSPTIAQDSIKAPIMGVGSTQPVATLIASDGAKVEAFDEACQSEELEQSFMMLKIQVPEIKDKDVKDAQITFQGNTFKGCYVDLDKNSIFIIDEHGSFGAVEKGTSI